MALLMTVQKSTSGQRRTKALEDDLEASGGHLEATGRALAVHFEVTWSTCGPLGVHLEPTWSPLGAHLEATWRPLGAQVGPRCAQETPKRRPRASQERRGARQEPPKSGQEPAKSGQDRPKSDQERPKRLPRASKLSPKGVRDPLQSCETAVQERLDCKNV